MNLEVSEVLITHVTYRGKARVMLHIGAGQSNNHQSYVCVRSGQLIQLKYCLLMRNPHINLSFQ